jgi:hypothetical protein
MQAPGIYQHTETASRQTHGKHQMHMAGMSYSLAQSADVPVIETSNKDKLARCPFLIPAASALKSCMSSPSAGHIIGMGSGAPASAPQAGCPWR